MFSDHSWYRPKEARMVEHDLCVGCEMLRMPNGMKHIGVWEKVSERMENFNLGAILLDVK